MGKALTSASNPGEPSDRLGKHGGRSKAECRKSPKRESERRGRTHTHTQKPARPTELNSFRMRKQPEPVVRSDRAAGGETRGVHAAALPGTGLAWEPLTPHLASWHPPAPRAKAALRPGAGCRHRLCVHPAHPRSPASQHPVSAARRCPAQDPSSSGRVGAHPASLEGLTQPGSGSQPSLPTDLRPGCLLLSWKAAPGCARPQQDCSGTLCLGFNPAAASPSTSRSRP